MDELHTTLSLWIDKTQHTSLMGEWYKGRSSKSIPVDKLIQLLPESIREDYSPKKIKDALDNIARDQETNGDGVLDNSKQQEVIDYAMSKVSTGADMGKAYVEYESFRYSGHSKVETLARRMSKIHDIPASDILIRLLAKLKEYADEHSQTVNLNDLAQVYSKDSIANVLNNIINAENLEIDLERDAFKKLIYHDEIKDKDHFDIIGADQLENIITVCEDAKEINTGTKSQARAIIEYTKYYFAEKAREDKRELMHSVIHDSSDESFFDVYCEKLYRAYNCVEDYDVFYTIMKHNYWQIKRRLFSYPVINDIFLTLRGPQGIGKGYLVDALFGSVFGRRYIPAWSIESIVDERNTPALGNMLVVNIDEVDTGKLGTMSGKSMSEIKARITANEYTYRPLYSNSTKTIPRSATFISTSNYHVYEIMNDETGMRRFFEFNSRNREQERFDYTLVAELREDSIRAFKSIDEENPKGYWDVSSEVGAKISAIQATYVKMNSAEEFLCEMYTVNEEIPYAECITPKDLYEEYSDYMRHNGNTEKKFNKMNFMRKVFDAYPLSKKVKDNTVRVALVAKNPYLEPKIGISVIKSDSKNETVGKYLAPSQLEPWEEK